ncbi:non-functional NADPH-dependent codeinone reductase 2-like [Castanea sativa]|uniref:non-functional NADPH-dependent codeinone reductase 2-like n=1 Tax=Castanea sativa TaxID=21020 RepID=UPI003F6505B6
MTTSLNSVTKIPKMELSSSSGPVSMPMIGFGTAADNNDGATLISAVLESIKLGYRHFDTASFYGSEQALGEAIAEALRLGLIASRDDLFITSKLWPSEAHAHLVLPSLQKSLRTLQLEYLDLYLIHWPITVTPGKMEFPFDKQDLMPMDFKSVWAAMEECQRLGLTKSIGVSNFSSKKLENLLSFATIPPSVNQVEMNPVWQQKKLTEFCKPNGIIVTAYSPLGAKGSSWGTNAVMDNEVLKEIAKTRGKTVAQVCLRWIYEQGAAPIVKSYNKERLKENLQIFDWELSEDDYDKIGQIKQRRLMPREELVSAHGPYKSVEELWDGEL